MTLFKHLSPPYFGEYHIHKHVVLHPDRSVNEVNSVSVDGAADTEQHKLLTCVILSKMLL